MSTESYFSYGKIRFGNADYKVLVAYALITISTFIAIYLAYTGTKPIKQQEATSDVITNEKEEVPVTSAKKDKKNAVLAPESAPDADSKKPKTPKATTKASKATPKAARAPTPSKSRSATPATKSRSATPAKSRSTTPAKTRSATPSSSKSRSSTPTSRGKSTPEPTPRRSRRAKTPAKYND